eukprot:TRINITY_DN3807_c0_g1_i6.p1 TRINITY_DN3807_c0_g1~~TRINITY_DN3807_c0_g1_i6.p1  ORF type:complete len:469 (+),score=119.19 TRINITY_DN3807_c0_g1_i6:56-1462(+)
MWNALKAAATKIGNEVTDALDTLTDGEPQEEQLTLDEGIAREQEEDGENKERMTLVILDWKERFELEKGSPPGQADFEASELFATYKLDGTRAASTGRGNKPFEGIPNVDLPSMSEMTQAADHVADNVTKWFTSASSEVTKAVHTGVHTFNEFVEAKKSEASKGEDSALLDIVLRIDTLEERTQAIHNALNDLGGEKPVTKEHLGDAKLDVHVTWEELEEEFYRCLADLNKLVQSDDSIGDLAKKQVTRVETLLEIGDAALVNLSKVSKDVKVFEDEECMGVNNSCTIEAATVELRSVKKTGDQIDCIIENGEPVQNICDEPASEDTEVGAVVAAVAEERSVRDVIVSEEVQEGASFKIRAVVAEETCNRLAVEADMKGGTDAAATSLRTVCEKARKNVEDEEVENITAAEKEDLDTTRHTDDSSPYTVTPIYKSEGEADTNTSFEEVRPPSQPADLDNPFEWDEEWS